MRTCVDTKTLKVLACPGQIEGALCALHEAAPELLETLKAIVDRIDGNFDSPAIKAMGPLEVDHDADVLKWANRAIEKAEGTI
jgi:hypothetical protein